MARHKYASDADRIRTNKVEDANGCWIWQLGLNSTTGYGDMRANGRRYLAHRFSYEVFVGPIPEGLHIDHLCRVRACCNPAHLEPVTPRENLMRGATLAAANAAKTHCQDGHEFDAVNTYVPRSGRRICRQCARAATRRWRTRQALRAAGIAA